MQHFVLVSNGARISRPKAGTVPEIDRVVKIEGFGERRKVYADRMGAVEAMAKMVSASALKTFAEGLAGCHVPAAPDWHAKFGLPRLPPAPVPPSARTLDVPAKAGPAGISEQDDGVETARRKLVCTACGTAIAFVVARFCWRNVKRFGGHAYCRDCQAGIGEATPPRSWTARGSAAGDQSCPVRPVRRRARRKRSLLRDHGVRAGGTT